MQVVLKNTTKLCSSKVIPTVNGKFPGPTLYAREGDTVIVRVTNHGNHNLTIHWWELLVSLIYIVCLLNILRTIVYFNNGTRHGVKQLGTGWADGPAYITQCPIQPGQNFIYKFTLTGQRGTLLWHAHHLWLRATLHGAIVILPKLGTPYPFPTPQEERIIILCKCSFVSI